MDLAVTQSLVTAFGLEGAPVEDGVAILSPPQSFAGGEEAYEEHIGAVAADALRSGQGAWRLARHLARRPIEQVLELGAGAAPAPSAWSRRRTRTSSSPTPLPPS